MIIRIRRSNNNHMSRSSNSNRTIRKACNNILISSKTTKMKNHKRNLQDKQKDREDSILVRTLRINSLYHLAVSWCGRSKPCSVVKVPSFFSFRCPDDKLRGWIHCSVWSIYKLQICYLLWYDHLIKICIIYLDRQSS